MSRLIGATLRQALNKKLSFFDSFLYDINMTFARQLMQITPLLLTDTELSILERRPQARYAKVKRAIASGDLIHIRRGLYCLSPELRKQELDAFVLANQIYQPSFVSLESALSHYRLIPEAVYTTTSLSGRRSREFKTPVGVYSYQYSKMFSFAGVERIQSGASKDYFLIASPVRAIFDYVHVNELEWQSVAPLIESLRMEPDAIATLDVAGARELAAVYKNKSITKLAQELLRYGRK